MDGLYVNGKGLSDFNGELFYYYQINSTQISTELYRGRNRTSFRELATTTGTRSLQLSIVFYGTNRTEALVNRSAFDAATCGLTEIRMPDGLDYTGTFTKRDMKDFVGGVGVEMSYTFEGIAHKPLVTVRGTQIACLSNIPQTDCRLSCVVSEDSEQYRIELNDLAITFGNTYYAPKAGDALTWDGILGRILVNGAPAAHWAAFSRLPFLVPGFNYITAPDEVTVEYYPTYL